MIIISLLTVGLLIYSIYSMNTSEYKNDVGYVKPRARLLLFTSILLLLLIICSIIVMACLSKQPYPINYMIEGSFMEVPVDSLF